MRVLVWVPLLFLLFFFQNIRVISAESSYVLPYPSNMPGSVFYKLDLLHEIVSKFWHFGDFGQFEYNLKLSDKYLVEAKTLFDYRQYFLGNKALLKSNFYFSNSGPNLLRAKKNGKDISEKKEILRSASDKHIEELSKIKKSVPKSFVWHAEKLDPVNLSLENELINSIKIRLEK
jgi:hypothetical protein